MMPRLQKETSPPLTFFPCFCLLIWWLLRMLVIAEPRVVPVEYPPRVPALERVVWIFIIFLRRRALFLAIWADSWSEKVLPALLDFGRRGAD